MRITMDSNAGRKNLWAKEELILALNFYFQANPLQISVKSPKLQNLCAEINELNVLFKEARLADYVNVRSPNSVYMKLCNFLRLDPSYSGVGLSRGGKLEEKIWKEFYEDRVYLSEISDCITQIAKDKTKMPRNRTDAILKTSELEVREGALLYSFHKTYERNPRIVNAKKQQILADRGELSCEICDFNFEKVYGELGKNYIECHHIVPLSQYYYQKKTCLNDLIVICANCHRMLHKSLNRLTPHQLRVKLKRHG